MAQETKPASMRQLLRTWRWLLVAPSLLLWWLIGQFDKTNISLVIADPSFLEELHLTGHYAELGSLMSLFFIGYGVSIFFWGFLVDRFGPRLCLMLGTLGWGAVMWMMSRATSLEELLLARFLLGAAEGNMWPVSNALTNRWFPAREHSRAQAFWLAGVTLGTAAGVPLVTALLLASGWRGMMAGLAALSLIPILVFAFIANRPRLQKGIPFHEVREIEGHQKAAVAVPAMSFRELLKSTSFWLIAFCMFISTTTVFTMIQWAPSFVTTHKQLSLESMRNWLTLGYVLSTVVAVAVGYIADRTMQRARTAAWTCLSFTLLVLPAAHLLPPVPSAVLLSTLIVVPVAVAALNGALLHALVRPEAVARGTGIYSGLGTMVAAVGPWAFGKLIGVLNGQYWGGFLFLSLLNAAGAAAYFTLHRISVTANQVSASKPIHEVTPLQAEGAGISLAEQ